MNSNKCYGRAVFLFLFAAAELALSGAAVAAEAGPLLHAPQEQSFRSMLDKVDAAQLQLQNGEAESFKALWSHSQDITLAGGFGGTVEKGWAKIGPRLEWVAKQFSNGTHTQERIVSASSGDLGYVVQLEHIRFVVPGNGEPTTRDYRVTMIFRREAGEWHIIHRQADSNLSKQAPK